MKGIATLIKLHKRTLDELRKKMVTLENQKAQFLALSAKLKAELENEIILAGKNPEMGNFFGDFSKRMQKRQEAIAADVRKLDQEMEKLNIEIADAFSEVKKFEIAQENIKRREQAEANRKETIEMDEIAGQQYTRRKKEEPT